MPEKEESRKGIDEDLTALARLVKKDLIVYVFVSRTGRKKELLSFKWSKHFEHDLTEVENEYFG